MSSSKRVARHPALPLSEALRIFCCMRCRKQVKLCSRCDRGHIYCESCAPAAARDRIRRAGKRYQATPAGRAKHAERQRRYRERQGQVGQDVTHQGSTLERPSAPPPPPPPPLATGVPAAGDVRRPSSSSPRAARRTTPGHPPGTLTCSTCSRCCSPFARRHSLNEVRLRKLARQAYALQRATRLESSERASLPQR